VGQISSAERRRNEEAIRAAMDRLLRGDLPPGGGCDLKTLAAEAGVTRTAFYRLFTDDGVAQAAERARLALQTGSIAASDCRQHSPWPVDVLAGCGRSTRRSRSHHERT
jgi:AcrR family transcriptional regulator